MTVHLPILQDAEQSPSQEEPPRAPPQARKSRVRARTISIKRLSKRELERGRLTNPTPQHERPLTRADCLDGGSNAERPCPFVSCVHHLYLDVSERSGAIKLNFPHMEVWDLPETCTLDIADRDGVTLEEVGAIMNLTRERVRQLEQRGIHGIKSHESLKRLNDESTE